MAAPPFYQPGVFEGAGYPVADVGGVEACAVAAEEEGFFLVVDGEYWTGDVEVLLEPVEGCFNDGNETGFTAFAFVNEEGLAAGVEVFDTESG